jgi:hypothetical protein
MRGLGLDELIGRELLAELGRRLSECDLRIARLLDREAAGDFRAEIDLRWEYSRREQFEQWMENASKQRGGTNNARP